MMERKRNLSFRENVITGISWWIGCGEGVKGDLLVSQDRGGPPSRGQWDEG